MKNFSKKIAIFAVGLATLASGVAFAQNSLAYEGDNYYNNAINDTPSTHYYSSYGSDDGILTAALLGFAGTVWLFSIAYSIILIIANWKIFTKAGQEGWKSIIPIYNVYVLTQIAGLPKWFILLYFVPFVNVAAGVYQQYKLAQAFGKDVAFTIGLILLQPVFILILAFSKNIKYVLKDIPLAGTPNVPPRNSAAANDPWVNNSATQPTQPTNQTQPTDQAQPTDQMQPTDQTQPTPPQAPAA